MPFTSLRRRKIYKSNQSIPHFRAVFYDISGRIVRSKTLFVGDEHEALEIIQRLADGRDIELWDGSKLLKRLCSKEEKASPNFAEEQLSALDADEPSLEYDAIGH